jgi:hypothetical protein
VPRGEVVLLRGLANVFSTGMDRLAARLAEAGYEAEVGNHLDWPTEARRLLAAARNGGVRRPLAAIGHSLGADDAIRLAGAAGAEGLALDLLVTFDPVQVGVVPPGPRHVVNFFLGNGLWGRPLQPAPGFEGSIENVEVGGEGCPISTSTRARHCIPACWPCWSGRGRGRASQEPPSTAAPRSGH